MSSFDPPKYLESVKIDIPLELDSSYPLAIGKTRAPEFISGLEAVSYTHLTLPTT